MQNVRGFNYLYIFLSLILILNFSCSGDSKKKEESTKDLLKISKAVIKFIEIENRLVSDLKLVNCSKMVDPWKNKYKINYKKSLIYSPGADKKHSKLRNNSWNDDVKLYFLTPYFKESRSSRKDVKNSGLKRKRKIAKRNLKVIATALRDYFRDYGKVAKDIFEINNLIITDIFTVKDPWGNSYEYDPESKIIFSRGKDKMHNNFIIDS
jgi:hypothetical protein